MAVGGAKGDPELASLDRSVLMVSLMVAGLDGTILSAEYAAFETLSKSCRGASAKNTRACLDAAVPFAGRLVVMAQTGAYDEKERLAAFVEMAEEVLPKRFSCGTLADLRRAFVLWVAMAVADGEFSELERQAIAALAAQFATMRTKKGLVSLLEPDFFAQAEKLVRQLKSEERRGPAEAELRAFVGTVESGTVNGRRHTLEAAGVAVGFAAACLAVG